VSVSKIEIIDKVNIIEN